MTRHARASLTVLVAFAGLASLLATNSPPPPHADLHVEDHAVCVGDPITVSWSVNVYGSTRFDPAQFRIATAPSDAFDPPLDGLALTVREGSVTTTVRQSGYVAGNDHRGYLWGCRPVSAMLCDGLGRQWGEFVTAVPVARVDAARGQLLVVVQDADASTRLFGLDTTLALASELVVDGSVSGLTITPAGSRLMTGTTTTELGDAPSAGRRGFVRVYDPIGTVDWTDVFEAAAVPGVALAADGDVLVAGTRGGHVGGFEAFLRRYDSYGNLRWERILASADGDDFAQTVATAPDGTTAVAGNTTGALGGARLGAVDTFIVTFEADGSPAWTLPTQAGDVLRALTVLPVGGLAAAYERPARLSVGEWTFDRVDVFLRRLTGEGDSCGERQFGSLGDDRASTMTAWPAFGSAALVVVGATNGDLLVKKTAGDWQWDAFAIIHVD